MKIQVGVDAGSYTFNHTTKAITISGITGLDLSVFLAVIHAPTGTMLYSAGTAALVATFSANVLTLNASVNTTAMADADKLTILIDAAPAQVAAQPVSVAALPLPTGAATQTTLAAIQTALGSPLQAGGSVVITTLPSIPAGVNAIGSVTVTTLPALPTGANTIGSVNILGGNATAVKVDGSAVTQPISAAALPLPAGAATSALQTTGNASLATIATNLPAKGQTTMANSQPVTLASDQFTSTKQMPTGVTEFEVSVAITRAANTTAYAANQVINGNAASTLPTLDFSGLIGAAARGIQINSVRVISNNGAATVPFLGVLALLNVNNPAGQAVTDQANFNPSYAVMTANVTTVFENVTNRVIFGTSAALYQQADVVRNAVTDATGHLYAALVTTNAYTPANGETITIAVKGYLLS